MAAIVLLVGRLGAAERTTWHEWHLSTGYRVDVSVPADDQNSVTLSTEHYCFCETEPLSPHLGQRRVIRQSRAAIAQSDKSRREPVPPSIASACSRLEAKLNHEIDGPAIAFVASHGDLDQSGHGVWPRPSAVPCGRGTERAAAEVA